MKILVATIVGALVTVCLFLVFGQRRNDQTTRARRVAESQSSANTIVRAGGNLQAALDKARYGDVIVLEAGATFRGPIVLPYKQFGSSDQFITITTSNLKGIPADGQRVDPKLHSVAMPKIVAPNGSVAISTAEGAHHYKVVGIEFAPAPDSQYVYAVVDLGKTDQRNASQLPHHLLFDRCYIHSTGLNKARRGVALNSGETSIVNSYISGFAGVEDETQGICGWNGSGPFYIVNNYIEGGGQNIMFGGADPAIPNLVPSDIEIRRNFLYKPAEWFGKATIKAVIELKNARRVVMDGNVLEGGRTAAFVLTIRNQGGTAPWSTLEDINVTNNIVRQAQAGFSLLGKDTYHPSQQMKRVRIANNLIVDVGTDYSAAFLAGCCGDAVTVEHNTVQQTGHIMLCYGPVTTNFTFRNNIVQFNSYGLTCPANALNAESRGNIIVDNLGAVATNGSPENIPRGNQFIDSLARLGLVDYANGDWRLSPTSKVKGRGTDGRDPGVDFDALSAAVAGTDVQPPYFGKKRR